MKVWQPFASPARGRTRAADDPRARPHRRAFVLVAILVVVILASMLALSLLYRMNAEETASAAGTGAEQAWAAAMSGVREAMRVAVGTSPGGLDWQDAAGQFRDRLLFDDGSDRWYFTVYSRGDAETGEVRFGLTDEAGKLNLNQASEEMLAKLPGMKPLLVNALIDFVDPDDEPHPEGAEQDYYDALPSPYAIFNGPFSTVGELLLVRGFSPAVVYGEDANLNFHLDANEADGDERFPPDNQDDILDAGLRPFITVSSYDLNQDSEGLPRVNLNLDAGSEDAPPSREDFPTNGLPATFIAYLDALHTNEISIEHVSELLEAKMKVKDATGKEVEIASGIGKNELALVLDRFTTTDEEKIPGLINVNVASAAVLLTVPGIDQPLAESIVSARGNLAPEKRRSTAWLFEENVVGADKFKEIAPYLTARSYQYSFNVVGFSVPSGRYRVLEAGIDLAGEQPVITYLRDITRLGLPFNVTPADEQVAGGLAATAAPRNAAKARVGERAGRVVRNAARKPPSFPKHG